MIQQPRFAHYPANMKFPKAIQKQIKIVEDLTAVWSEEDTEYAHRQEKLRHARRLDAEALKKAAIAGEPDPGTEATSEAERALLYQEQRVKATAQAVSRESSVLTEMFKANRLELFKEACETAERTVQEFRSEIASLTSRAREIEANRNNGLAPLRWVSSLTDGDLSYDPHFPIQGSFQFPNTAEQKAVGIVALLKKIYLDRDRDVA